MNMGRIHIQISPSGREASFVMETPEGPRPVNLACDTRGYVCVEEVAGGRRSMNSIKIQHGSLQAQSDDASHGFPSVEVALETSRQLRDRT